MYSTRRSWSDGVWCTNKLSFPLNLLRLAVTVVMRPSDCSRVVGTEQLQRSVFPLLLSFPRHVIKQGIRCVTPARSRLPGLTRPPKTKDRARGESTPSGSKDQLERIEDRDLVSSSHGATPSPPPPFNHLHTFSMPALIRDPLNL